MMVEEFNLLGKTEAAKELFSCCGSVTWVSKMMEDFPFSSEKELVEKAGSAWYGDCHENDWKESFTHHPRIGDAKSLVKKYAGQEQSGVKSANSEIIEALEKGNSDYENKFGFIFIICATGKSATEMLRLLQDRLKNDVQEELNIAMGEQHKITLLRFKKLLINARFQFLNMSQITTHVLDTSMGKPGKDITVRLMNKENHTWQTICQGITNEDGRISDLLPEGKLLSPGIYKLVFETGTYFMANDIKGFYLEVEIQFMVMDDSHYHVPLLISPWGYSTYRGS